jgi:hypothetical protein
LVHALALVVASGERGVRGKEIPGIRTGLPWVLPRTGSSALAAPQWGPRYLESGELAATA